MGSADAAESGTCTQWANLPACVMVMTILSENPMLVMCVRRPLMSPEVDFDGAGKGASKTLGCASVADVAMSASK